MLRARPRLAPRPRLVRRPGRGHRGVLQLRRGAALGRGEPRVPGEVMRALEVSVLTLTPCAQLHCGAVCVGVISFSVILAALTVAACLVIARTKSRSLI